MHHGAGLRRLKCSEKIIEALSGPDPLSAEVCAADRALLNYSIKLTRNLSSIGSEDIEELRRQGFDDRAIHDACQVVAYFNYVNRVANGLGVEMESA